MSTLEQTVYIYPIEDVLKSKDFFDNLSVSPQLLKLELCGEGGFKKIYKIAGTSLVLASYTREKTSDEQTILQAKSFLLHLQKLYNRSPKHVFAVLKDFFCLPVAIYKTIKSNRVGFIYPAIPSNFYHIRYGTESHIYANPRFFEEVFHGESLKAFLFIALKFNILFTWLHQFDVVYGDISYNNILVDLKHSDVYIIDTDGLHDTSKDQDDDVQSPWFNVPEVMLRGKTTPLAIELFCFYIFIYGILMHRHPLRGTQEIPSGLSDADTNKYIYGTHPVYLENATCSPNELFEFLKREYKTDNKWLNPCLFSLRNIFGEKLSKQFETGFGVKPDDRPQTKSFLSLLYEIMNSIRPCRDFACDLGWHVTYPKFQINKQNTCCPDCKTEFNQNFFFHVYQIQNAKALYAGLSLSIYNFRALYHWDFNKQASFIPHLMNKEGSKRIACIVYDKKNVSIVNLSNEDLFIGHIDCATLSSNAQVIKRGMLYPIQQFDVIWQGDYAENNLLIADFYDLPGKPQPFVASCSFSYSTASNTHFNAEQWQAYLDYYDVWSCNSIIHPLAGKAHFEKISHWLENDSDFDVHSKDIVHHLRISAYCNYTEAQYHLGVCYALGRGVRTSKVEALQLWQKAAENNSTLALDQIYNKLLHQKNYDKLITILKQISEKGIAYASFLLGKSYEDSDNPQHSVSEAIQWYQLAADRNYKEAVVALGNLKQSTSKSSAPEYEFIGESQGFSISVGTGTSQNVSSVRTTTQTPKKQTTSPQQPPISHPRPPRNIGSTYNKPQTTPLKDIFKRISACVSTFLFILSISFAWFPAKLILKFVWEWLIKDYRNYQPKIYGFATEPPIFYYAWCDWIVYCIVVGFFAFFSIACAQRNESWNDHPLDDDDLRLCKRCLKLWGCYVFANPLCFLPFLIISWIIKFGDKAAAFHNVTAFFSSCIFVPACLLSLYMIYRVIVQENSFILRRIACAMLCVPTLVFIGYVKMVFLLGWAGFPYYLMWLLFPGITSFFR